MIIAGILVTVKEEKKAEIKDVLSSFAEVTIYEVEETDRIVLVLEAKSRKELKNFVEREIASLAGVINAAPAYTNSELDILNSKEDELILN
ncbi:chaperone NapD [Fuchsiella alkaliacetigena]|uniref:chaperone NapD n=1 Tax=Fuchsiella alkaliacetigena TaxID=957042 RepID=UPI00200A193F|nr:chaperone NapD [Fuchsiella alkaliacetigena]MCK8824805.1 chaperone NapD [Fuchsiella alkaliacetigena]